MIVADWVSSGRMREAEVISAGFHWKQPKMRMSTTAIIVPARLASTRFPRKLLHRIRGKPLILWVAERLAAQTPEIPVHFAVDDDELARPLASRGFSTIFTDPAHASGTDRLAEANRRVGAEYVINVQADEPLVTANQIRMLERLVKGGSPMATLAVPFARVEDFDNPNQVKVVVNLAGEAIYFSRSPIPYPRDLDGGATREWLRNGAVHRHLGLYAYRADFLEEFTGLPAGRLERIEKLEQLRVLEHGFRIAVGITDEPTIGIDTAEDAAAFERHLAEQEELR
jgi:3-deoxy-manno-octulosonate cytidylyltransferase (CMP-KDO synthetase)